MKYFIFPFALLTIGILGSCSDASTDPNKKVFPTYKYSFSGKVSNPKNITIPDDAYFLGIWRVASALPYYSNYSYYYGEGYIDKTTNTFTIGFNDTLPVEATNRSPNYPAVLGVGSFRLITSPSKISGKDITNGGMMQNATVWGGLNWSGIVYVGGGSPLPWLNWNEFKQGYTYAKGASDGKTEYFVESDPSTMEILIDTAQSSFKFPNWQE